MNKETPLRDLAMATARELTLSFKTFNSMDIQ